MALGIVRRWSWVPLVAGVAVSYGCSSSPASDDDSGGCSKDTDCANGRICEDKKCVDDPNQGGVLGGTGGSSGSNGTSASGGTLNGTGGTQMPGNGGTGGSSTGGTGGTGNSSGTANGGSASGSGGAGGTGGSSGGTAGTSGTSGTSGTCSEDDPATCPTTDSMSFCSAGAIVTFGCDDYCGQLGFPTGPCAAPDGCACDFANPTDETCLIAMNAVCGCLETTETPCVEDVDPNDPDSIYFYPPFIYASCHGGNDEDMTFLHCIADQAQMDPAPLCSDAFTACGAGSGGSAGAAP